MKTHEWITTGKATDGNREQYCNTCEMVRIEGPWGLRDGKGWAYYRNGGFIGFRTINDSQFPCESVKK